MRDSSQSNVLETIPSPGAIRERLAQHLVEARLLRQLLRVSENVAVERERQKAAHEFEGATS